MRKDFLMKFLVVDPTKRFNVYNALQNDWLLGNCTRPIHLSAAVDNMRVMVNKKKTQVK